MARNGVSARPIGERGAARARRRRCQAMCQGSLEQQLAAAAAAARAPLTVTAEWLARGGRRRRRRARSAAPGPGLPQTRTADRVAPRGCNLRFICPPPDVRALAAWGCYGTAVPRRYHHGTKFNFK